jgi:outer membrane murein-binding lipoprotein Lpp
MLGLRDERRRRRRRVRWRVFRWLLVLGFIAAAVGLAYETGARVAQRTVTDLNDQIRSLTLKVDELETQSQAQTAQIAAAAARADEWQQRYRQDVPAGEVKQLFEAVQVKLGQGVTAERLRFVVEQIERQRACEQGPQVKRVLVRTPLEDGTERPAAFTNGSMTLSLSGASARDAAGNPQAWFDPSQPVTARLTRRGGKSLDATGALPLHRSMVDGDREYRLSIVAAPRGFAQVTLERCRFP